MFSIESFYEEVDLLIKLGVSILLLIMLSFYNYIRSLDKKTLIEDITLVRAILHNKRVYIKEDGDFIVCMKDSCTRCNACKRFNDQKCIADYGQQ